MLLELNLFLSSFQRHLYKMLNGEKIVKKNDHKW